MKAKTKSVRAPSSKPPKKRKTAKPEEKSEFPNGFVKTKEGKAIPIEKGPRGGLYYKKPKSTKSTYLSAKK